MDEMKIKGKFFDKIASSLIKKYLRKNFGIEPVCLAVTNLDASLGSTAKIVASIEMVLNPIDTEKVKSELLKKIF